MGTLFKISLYAPDKASAESAAEAAFHRNAALDDIMSDYQADSELMKLCEQPVGVPKSISADLLDVLQRAQKFSELSNGAFDVSVGPYVRLWRFSRKRKALPEPAELAAARASVGWRHLRLGPRARAATLLVPNMRLDLGGIAKGYAADEALHLLKGHGIDRALVAASGDIAIGDPPPDQAGWKIAIAAMDTRTNETTRTVLLHNAGVSTSGDTEQFIEINGIRYSHIVDPNTGLGLTERRQVTIIARNATTSDALATAVSVLGPKRGLALVDSLPKTATFILTKTDHQTQSFSSRRFHALAPSTSSNAAEDKK
jgi:thiamine biosynthesis lipoprotein